MRLVPCPRCGAVRCSVADPACLACGAAYDVPLSAREVPGWDEYFVTLAHAVSLRSPDPSTQHGAVIADAQHRLLGTGYNGTPPGFPPIDWSRPHKYPFVIHAEENAMTFARQLDLAGCTLYVTGPPCSKCMLRIVSRGVRRVVYGPRGSACVDERDWALTRHIADQGKVGLVEWLG